MNPMVWLVMVKKGTDRFSGYCGNPVGQPQGGASLMVFRYRSPNARDRGEGEKEKKEKSFCFVCLLGSTGSLVTALNLMVVPTACGPIGRAFVVKKEKNAFCLRSDLVLKFLTIFFSIGRRFERFCPLQLFVMGETKVGQ
jgi:hypothetical protein